MISITRILLLAIFSVLCILFWDYEFMLPFKIIVVLLHEISHALGALLTGGVVKSIGIEWNESGEAFSQGGNYFVIGAAGYIGSVFWGSLMLRASLRGQFTRTVSFIVGFLVIVFTILYLKPFNIMKISLAIVWGLSLISTAILHSSSNRFLLMVAGVLTSLYAIYDLTDFLNGQVMLTDAGRLAKKLASSHSMQKLCAYFIAAFITIFAFYILYIMIRNAFRIQVKEPEPAVHLEEPAPGAIDPRLLAVLARLQSLDRQEKEK